MKMNMKILFLILAVLPLLPSCAASGPSSSEVEKHLDSQAKGLWDFRDVKIVDSRTEKNGEAEAVYLTFKATGENSEPTYDLETSIPSVSPFSRDSSPQLQYVKELHPAGTKLDMNGNVLLIKEDGKDWQSSVKLNPALKLQGVPASSLGPNQVLRGSPEEKKFLAQQKETARLDREATLTRFFTQETNGYLSGDFRGPIQLRFTEVDEQARQVAGQMTFAKGVIKSFSGKYTDRELSFITDQVVQGEDGVGVGTQYSFLIESLEPSTRKIQGTYGHRDRRSGEVYVNLRG